MCESSRAKFFAHLKKKRLFIGLVAFFYWNVTEFGEFFLYYILDTSLLLDICFAGIFYQSGACFFVFIIVTLG